MAHEAARELPPVHRILSRPELAEVLRIHGNEAVTRAVRLEVDDQRQEALAGRPFSKDPGEIAARSSLRLATRPTLRRVINATGILLHTGLGRAPLAEEAIAAVAEVARSYCNLEFRLDTNERGRRTEGIENLLRQITGAEAATVVNNNAAATILALRSLAWGREVVVSRGQLVEIGGSYRLPEIFEVSGVKLREVGTTNKTRLSDYERAINLDTAALLRVHTSNFRVVGFTESVAIEELAALGRSRGIATIDDIGSGALGPDRPPWMGDEPTVAEGLAAGADLVLFSGDKLLGGPQCGILVGTRDAISKVEADPLMRAFRVDKMSLAALEATLRLGSNRRDVAEKIPLWRFASATVDSLRGRCERIVDRLRSQGLEGVDVSDSIAHLGGGSLPDSALASAAVRIMHPWPPGCPGEEIFARRLREGDPAVVPRVQKGAVWLDLRSVHPDEDGQLVRAILHAVVA